MVKLSLMLAGSTHGQKAKGASSAIPALFCRHEANEGDEVMKSVDLLCIDDRLPALEHRKAALEPHGYNVKVASSGPVAMKILQEAPVSAVLLEYRFEGMDVEAVACQIKRRFPSQPIILLSGYAEVPERMLWLVDEYVMKSEMPAGLVNIIERLTSQSVSAPAGASGPQGFVRREDERRDETWRRATVAA
jgi:response regulator RpfG family c-di-GMP phosphodiesterase